MREGIIEWRRDLPIDQHRAGGGGGDPGQFQGAGAVPQKQGTAAVPGTEHRLFAVGAHREQGLGAHGPVLNGAIAVGHKPVGDLAHGTPLGKALLGHGQPGKEPGPTQPLAVGDMGFSAMDPDGGADIVRAGVAREPAEAGDFTGHHGRGVAHPGIEGGRRNAPRFQHLARGQQFELQEREVVAHQGDGLAILGNPVGMDEQSGGLDLEGVTRPNIVDFRAEIEGHVLEFPRLQVRLGIEEHMGRGEDIAMPAIRAGSHVDPGAMVFRAPGHGRMQDAHHGLVPLAGVMGGLDLVVLDDHGPGGVGSKSEEQGQAREATPVAEKSCGHVESFDIEG